MDRAGESAELEVRTEGESLTRARTYDEIYRGHAARYEELVAHEDFRNNLGRTLREIVRWEGKTVVEAGIGTGRVSSLYIDRVRRAFAFDRSAHMLAFARKRFEGFPIRCARREHAAIRGVRGEIFVEGW